MSVYNINGTATDVAYDVSGAKLSQAYDMIGSPLLDTTATLKVMTYNVQRFRGINAQQAMQNEIVAKYDADIIGMQEIGSTTMPTVGATALSGYLYTSIANASGLSNPAGIVSKSLPFANVQTVKFVNQDPEDISQWNEERGYIRGDLTVNGKTITVISTHLAYLTESVKWQQMQELFNVAEQCEYVILTGDFNSMQMTASADDYIHMYKPFVDAGYHLANNSPDSGFQNTFTSSATATSLSELQTAPDTIIVSGNINIESVVFDTTKFSYLNGSAIDHIPLIAEVTI